jgi:hypothetical protein
MASKSRTTKSGRSASAKSGRGSAKASKPAPRGGKRAGGAAKVGKSKASGALKKSASKKAAKKTTTSKATTSRKATTKAAKRPAPRAKVTAVGAQPMTAGGVVRRNPLTHRGTRPSRTQLLLEHQGAPVEPVAMGGVGGTSPDVRDSNLAELVRSTEVRNLTLKSQSAGSRGKRVENLLSGSANTRIGGHASGAGRRAQGRRDAAQRGDKRPGSAE